MQLSNKWCSGLLMQKPAVFPVTIITSARKAQWHILPFYVWPLQKNEKTLNMKL